MTSSAAVDHVEVWTDGSFYHESRVGGWAWTLGAEDHESGSGHREGALGSVQMEAIAVLKAIKRFEGHRRITIHTDLKALPVTLTAIETAIEQGGSTKKPSATWRAELQQIAERRVAARRAGRSIEIRWVSRSTPETERAHRLARESAGPRNRMLASLTTRKEAAIVPSPSAVDHVDVWTHGAYWTSRRVGGWAWTIGAEDHESGSGHREGALSSDQMEAIAVLKALTAFEERRSITLHIPLGALLSVLREIELGGRLDHRSPSFSAEAQEIVERMTAAEQDGRSIDFEWDMVHRRSSVERRRARRLAQRAGRPPLLSLRGRGRAHA